MPGKEKIVEELGDLLLPNLVNQGLLANDRAKYLMTLLQSARQHADQPESSVHDLKQERTDCGIEESGLDSLIERSSRTSEGKYRIPNVDRVCGAIVENVRGMLAPLESAQELSFDNQSAAMRNDLASYQRRLRDLIAEAPRLDDDLISGDTIDRITAAQASQGDSLHLLVMHLHKELNRLQQQIAAESIDGARVYCVTEPDRSLIKAFMRGLNRTRKLKFDHPGLDTTATRTDGQLVIQNDIGTTDAHVLVIHVKPREITVTYTDVHIQRLLFFQNLLSGFSVQWEDTRSRHSQQLSESLYHLSVGRFLAEDANQREEYLEYLGSRLVFLIDWNRARKRLRKLAPKRVCLEVLRWAAAKDLGHMAFLKAGGEQLVFDALQLSSSGALHLGGQLADIIGAERAAEFLKFILKTAAEGLLAGQSELLIRDQVRAELRHYLETAHQGQLELAADHAALIVELAATARDCLLHPGGFTPEYSARESTNNDNYVARCAQRAKQWEHSADKLLTKARTATGERAETKAVAELIRVADDAADDLEEGVFLLNLFDQLAIPVDTECHQVMRGLAELQVSSAREYLKAVENARHISRNSSREEMGDFLTAVDQVISLEHAIDDIHRRAKASILACSDDHKQLHLSSELADTLESSSDALMRAAVILRDYVLREVIAR